METGNVGPNVGSAAAPPSRLFTPTGAAARKKQSTKPLVTWDEPPLGGKSSKNVSKIELFVSPPLLLGGPIQTPDCDYKVEWGRAKRAMLRA